VKTPTPYPFTLDRPLNEKEEKRRIKFDKKTTGLNNKELLEKIDLDNRLTTFGTTINNNQYTFGPKTDFGSDGDSNSSSGDSQRSVKSVASTASGLTSTKRTLKKNTDGAKKIIFFMSKLFPHMQRRHPTDR